MERRDFLTRTGAAMITAAIPAIASPKKVRAGMLGTGPSHFAGKLKAMQNSPDYEVRAVVENNSAARSRLESDPRYPSLKWTTESELLGDPDIDLVVVECRVWEAVPWGAKVIAAGKHLHLEKPPGNEYDPFKESWSRKPDGRNCCSRPGICGAGTTVLLPRSMPQRRAGSEMCSWFAAR